jgi:toxin HigB-1
MIQKFRHRGLKRLFEEDDPRKLPSDMLDRIRLILARLNTARNLEAMNIHSYHLHELKGDRKGIWSVTVRANWRITFRFENEDAFDVNFEDYH